METLLSLPKLAQKAGIVSVTARRYTQNFPEIFIGVKIDGLTKYPERYAEVIKRIYELCEEGHSRSEISSLIKEEYPNIGDTTTAPEKQTSKMDLILDVLVRIEKKLDIMERIEKKLESLGGDKPERQHRRINDPKPETKTAAGR